jgi:predicted RNase H-like HicB family nuclease
MIRTFTAVIQKTDNWHMAGCPEAGTVSQGKIVEEAIAKLKETTELYLDALHGTLARLQPKEEVLLLGWGVPMPLPAEGVTQV